MLSAEDYLHLLEPEGIVLTPFSLSLKDFQYRYQIACADEKTVYVFANKHLDIKSKHVERRLNAVKEKLLSDKVSLSTADKLVNCIEKLKLASE